MTDCFDLIKDLMDVNRADRPITEYNRLHIVSGLGYFPPGFELSTGNIVETDCKDAKQMNHFLTTSFTNLVRKEKEYYEDITGGEYYSRYVFTYKLKEIAGKPLFTTLNLDVFLFEGGYIIARYNINTVMDVRSPPPTEGSVKVDRPLADVMSEMLKRVPLLSEFVYSGGEVIKKSSVDYYVLMTRPVEVALNGTLQKADIEYEDDRGSGERYHIYHIKKVAESRLVPLTVYLDIFVKTTPDHRAYIWHGLTYYLNNDTVL